MATHTHSHSTEESGARSLMIAALLTGGMMLVEFLGGWWSNSLALVSDAGHMLTDVGALLVSLWALKLAQTPADARRTFGRQRVEILAALLNGVTLLVLCVYIVYEAIPRLFRPEPIQSTLMMAVAFAGLWVNIIGFLLLRKHTGESLNIRGALLHVLGDLFSSVAVLVGGVFVWLMDWRWLDPLLSLLIAAVILHGAYRVTREALGILMEYAPGHLQTADVTQAILDQPGVTAVHHLHVWSLSSRLHALSAHIVVDDQLVSETAALLEALRQRLREKYGVGHTVFQVEHRDCADAVCGEAEHKEE